MMEVAFLCARFATLPGKIDAIQPSPYSNLFAVASCRRYSLGGWLLDSVAGARWGIGLARTGRVRGRVRAPPLAFQYAPPPSTQVVSPTKRTRNKNSYG